MSPTTSRSATAALGPAFEHTTRQLFHPFRMGQWVRLGLVGFLAGEGIPGCNIQLPGSPSSPSNQPTAPAVPAFHSPSSPELLTALVLGITLILIILVVVFAWIGSRARFVLFDSVVSGECHVRTYWRRRELPGWRYFLFQLLFAVASIALMGLFVGGPLMFAVRAGWFTDPGGHIGALILGGVCLFATFLAVLVVLIVVQVLIKDFVVPQMALEGVTVSDGCRHLASLMRADIWSYAGYLGLKFLLAIGAGIVFFVPIMIAFLILLIPIGAVGGLAVVGAKIAGLMWNPLTISLVVIGGGLTLLVMLVVTSVISAPVMVFFPAYSMYFFAARYPALANALQPPAPPPA